MYTLIAVVTLGRGAVVCLGRVADCWDIGEGMLLLFSLQEMIGIDSDFTLKNVA